MKQTLEREIKLQAPAGFDLPALPGSPIETRRFTSTYVDTHDLRLASHGITLRRRVENRKGLWQLKIPQAGSARLEIEAQGGPGAPPRDMLALLAASLRGSRLEQVAKLRTVRSGMVVTEDLNDVAEVVIDAVQALEGNRVVKRFTELEVELLGGSEQDLKSIVAVLKSAGAFTGDQRAKVFQILDYTPELPANDRSASELAQVQGFITDQFNAIVRHDAGTRIGTDPEDLHQQRVAIRKLRSLLMTAEMLEPQWAEALGAELEWIGDALNPVRDLDVMIPYLAEDIRRLPPEDTFVLKPFVSYLRAEREEARAQMMQALASERYIALLGMLEEATRSIPVRLAETDLRTGAERRFSKLRKAVRNLPDDPPEEDLHRVRRLAKKARYAAEVVLPGSPKPIRAYLKSMKSIQDVLGDLQDASVAEERIRAYLPEVEKSEAAFALGRLAELQAAKKRRAAAAFPGAWKKLGGTGKKAWK